jgi:hypothetical protein
VASSDADPVYLSLVLHAGEISRSFMRKFLATLLLFAALAAIAVLAPGGSRASTPPTHEVTVPQPGQTTTVKWTGTIPPGADPASDCNLSVADDEHQVKVNVPAGLYDSATAEFTFKITWKPVAGANTSDEILTVNDSQKEIDSSDGSGTSEMVVANDLKGDTYNALACGYTNAAPQPYEGELTIRTKSKAAEASVPSAPAKGLQFSASVPADNQRDESEPLMETDPDGNIYTCGPTGFSNASDYAQVSTDGGDQFHLMGTPPRGQQGLGGGGDCGLGTGVKKNPDGKYQYAYAGLGPLTGFTTSTSPDIGRTLFNAGPAGNTNTAQGGGADRQWLTFLNDQDVLLNYNQQAPRNVVVQKSTDGGFSYVGAGAVAAGNPDFPGPMRTIPADQVGAGTSAERVAFFGWNSSDDKFSYVNLSISDKTGLVWKDCVAQKIPLDQSGGLGAFTVADADNAGNVYLTYSDKKAFHTYLTTLTVDRLKNCNQTVDPATATGGGAPPTTDPGWSRPIQVDRDNVRTTVFPWLVAGGEPGRVAVAFYGTETQGDPNTGAFKASWDVYVSQSVNALSADRTVSQVKATTHPFHYDSVCLMGLGCDLANPPGDRSLGDFFAIDYSPTTKKLSLVYNQSNKQPDESTGRLGTPAVVNQIAGPSNGGGDLGPITRPVVRSHSDDPSDDALVNYSSLTPGPSNFTGNTARNPAPTNAKAMDFQSEDVVDEIDPATGAKVANGGFTVKFKLADLSTAALQQAMSSTGSQSLLWVFRFFNGYLPSAASVRYNPGQGFTFGYNDLTVGSAQCGSSGDKCMQYPGDTPLKGKVDQAAGTMTLSVPRTLLKALNGPTGDGQRPSLTKAQPGSLFYDATLFSLGNVSPTQSAQSFLYPADNTPAMDFELPGVVRTVAIKPVTAAKPPATPGPTACAASAGFSKVSASRSGRSAVNLSFTRRLSSPVQVDVFRVSEGSRVVKERLVARFKNRTKSFRWNGVSNRGKKRRVGTGYYFVRYTMLRGGKRIDVRRLVLRRSGGRFSRRADYFRRATCDLLNQFKLERPVFGGPRRVTLKASYRLAAAARVTVTITKGSKVIKRYKAVKRAAKKTYRITLPAKRRARGDYKIRLQATAGGQRVNSVLTSRRL